MRILIYLLIISAIIISGCVVKPVSPEDISVSVKPVIMKEYRDQDISISVLNNATEPIDSVKVVSLEPFTVLSGGNVNIPAKTKEGASSVTLNAKIQAPGFKMVTGTSTLTLSYASGKDDTENPVVKTKAVPVQITVLPDAKLQFV